MGLQVSSEAASGHILEVSEHNRNDRKARKAQRKRAQRARRRAAKPSANVISAHPIGRARRGKKGRGRGPRPPNQRCWEWILAAGEFHYAKNRSTFSEYRKLHATVGGTPVYGIGTVTLKLSSGSKFMNAEPYILVLEEVLHTPRMPCNGFVPGLLGPGYSFDFVDDGMQGFDPEGCHMWFAQSHEGFARLLLSGRPLVETGMTIKGVAGQPFSLSVLPGEHANLPAGLFFSEDKLMNRARRLREESQGSQAPVDFDDVKSEAESTIQMDTLPLPPFERLRARP